MAVMSELAAGKDPLWWLVTLEHRLQLRQADMLLMDRYYRGDHPLPFLTRAHEAKMRDEFRRLLDESRSNFMRLVVDATEERLNVDGFRLSAESDPAADSETWDIWQANQMDAQSQTAFLESLIKGVSYLSVWDDFDEDGYADIAIEDPLQTIVAYEPGSNYRRRAAAVKVWLDDVAGERRANVYLPGGIYKYSAPVEVPQNVTPTVEQQIQISWSQIEDGFVENPLGVVPIIPLRNRPRLLIEGESELSDVFRTQNQINAFIFLQALAGYFGAHRQRWAAGITMMEDAQGRSKPQFDAGVDKLWADENPEVKFGEFSQTDLGGYIKSIEQKVLHIAVTTRTPRHYLFQEGQSPSGDAIQSAESGLVKKVERKQRTFGEGLEEAMRLARRIQTGKPPVRRLSLRARRASGSKPELTPDSEVVWVDAQTHSPAAATDAVIKQFLARVIPHSVVLEKLGYTQTQMRRILDAAGGDKFVEQVDPNAVASAQRSDLIRNTPPGA